MTVWRKQGVIGDLAPIAQKGLGKVASLYEINGEDLYITSIREGNHSPGSFHYIGQAFDFRRGGITLEAVRGALGDKWDVLNSSHGTFHAEFDPV